MPKLSTWRRHCAPARGALLLASLIAATTACAADLATLTILHTNDLHARLSPMENGRGGFARLAGVIRRERAGCTDCLLLNAGDLAQGTPVSTMFRGLPIYQIGNLLGFDASTLGNHDFDYGWTQTRKFVETARYPIVLANLVDANNAPFVPPSVTLNVNGLRVAVIGLLTDDMPTLSTVKNMGPWHETSVFDSVRRLARELRQSADLVIVLGHVNVTEEAVILHMLPDAAIVVTGHAHNGMEAPLTEGNRALVRVKANGEELGRLEVVVDKESKSLVSWHWRRIPVDASAPVASDVAEQVAHWEGEVTRAVDQPIGVSAHEFAKPEVKALMERIMRETTGSDLAFMNSGGVRDILPKGRLLARHAWNIMPFDNRIVTGRFKGSQLPKVVTEGKTIDPEREYTLAVNDFTAENQSAASQLNSRGLKFSSDGPLLRDAMIEWITKQKVVE
jgi:5'-nucleotidase / UDP-sugar diphosphatase